MNKVRVILAAIVVAFPLAVLPAEPASACDRYPCQTRCDVNLPFSVDESGTITQSERPLVDCYY